MAIDINIPSQNVVQTALEWSTDTTIYTDKFVLYASDELFSGTNQMKSKKANGVNTFADLDYMPLDELKSDIDLNTTDRHTHTNKVTLDKFGESLSGLPTYNGLNVDTTVAQRDVYDGLDSLDNSISLSANNGKVLKDVQDTQQTAIDLNTDKVSYPGDQDLSGLTHTITQTKLEWSTDTTVYSDNHILWVSDVFYLFTDQMKYKKADGVKTYANLDYMPNDEYYINSFKTRVDILGGTTEAEDTLRTQLEELDVTPSLMITPNSVSDGKIYSIIGNSSATDGDLSRAGTKTRVNSAGLIEEVASDVASIDYDGEANSILFDEASENLIPYSEDFSDASWIKTNSSITLNSVVSPDGTQNASTLNFTSGANSNIKSTIPVTVGQDYTISVWLKSTSGNQTRRFGASEGNASLYIDVDITNEWQRFEVLISSYAFTGLATRISNANDNSIAGSILVWGAQLEALPYATSYIPTNGSAVTRAQDVANNFGDVNTFNSSEGVLFVEMAALVNNHLAATYISLNDGTYNNRVAISFRSGTDVIRCFVRSIDGTTQIDFSFNVPDITDFNKVAIKYKLNDFAIWINGVEVTADLVGIPPVGLINFSFSEVNNTGAALVGKVKQLHVYKEALTDTQLTALTTL